MSSDNLNPRQEERLRFLHAVNQLSPAHYDRFAAGLEALGPFLARAGVPEGMSISRAIDAGLIDAEAVYGLFGLDAPPNALEPLAALASPRVRARRAGNGIINDINCDPNQAEHIYISPAGDNCPTNDGFRRFDEVLYRNTSGYFFLVRPLAPDEAREWLEDDRHDSILARQIFPDD